ncbi:MAG: imelysin family protein [Bacteroidota bacterium]
MTLNRILKFGFFSLAIFTFIMVSCSDDDPMVNPDPDPDPDPDTTSMMMDTMDIEVEATIENLLTNQVKEVIIPTMQDYQVRAAGLLTATEAFVNNTSASTLEDLRSAYMDSYVAYQAAAVHDYYATVNVDLVNTTNLYPIDVEFLDELIDTESYNFNVTAQQRANGFPAIDYLLYGLEDVVSSFSNEPKRANFLLELAKAMKEKADNLVDRWTGSLEENFINNGGTELGSSVSVQLNGIMVYYEDHVRGNKVGLPIGRSGPNDTPFDPDPTIIEAYYQSIENSNDDVSLALLKAAVEEMEDIYLGTTSLEDDGIGYEDLLLDRDQESLDTDIKNLYTEIYDKISNRTRIVGDDDLYNSIQALVTLYKSDLFPVLNVQDADGSNDGD